MAVEVVDIGPLQRRASSIKSNAWLYSLIEDMAKVVDTIPGRFDEVHGKLDTILEKLNARD